MRWLATLVLAASCAPRRQRPRRVKKLTREGSDSSADAQLADRDTKFSAGFEMGLAEIGTASMRTPYQAPNANACAERFVIKGECLDRMILFGEGHLRRAIREYFAHDHGERDQQGLGNELIEGRSSTQPLGEVKCHQRLGGLLRYYHRAA
ncbi:MAG: hypothetical protein ACYTDU_10550 [Planctomycetota bacterium]|jgi:hypothetical protein